MKKNIHPKYFNNCKVTCACGNIFITGSTLPAINVEVCSACHPFFTGEQKFVDTLGRVERFKQKQQVAKVKKYVKKSLRKKKAEDQQKAQPKSLREMLQK